MRGGSLYVRGSGGEWCILQPEGGQFLNIEKRAFTVR